MHQSISKLCWPVVLMMLWINSINVLPAQECGIFLSFSGFGEPGALNNNTFNGSPGDSGSLYIWIDENVSIDTGIFLDVKPCVPGSIQFTGAQVFNPNISISGTPIDTRWAQAQDIVVDDCASLNAFIGTSGGGGASGGGRGIDPTLDGTGTLPLLDEGYDPVNNAFLYGRIDFDIISDGGVEFCCEPGCGLIVNDCAELDLDCCPAFIEGDGKTPVECTFESNNILCDLDAMGQATGDYILTGTFTNLQDIPGTHLFLLPDATPAGVEVCYGNGQQGMQIDPPLNNGDSYEVGSDPSDNSNAIIVKNAMPGDEVCFTMTLLGENGVECCTLEVCFEMPPCDCLQVDRRFDEISDIVCNADGTVDFSYSFQLTNLFGMDVYHGFLGSLGPELFVPDYFDLAANGPLAQGDSIQVKTIVTGALPGANVEFLISIHNEDLSECCTRQHDVVAPTCEFLDVREIKGDVNGDGVINLLDVGPFVAVITGGGPYTATADVNCDGVNDLLDVGPFIGLLTP